MSGAHAEVVHSQATTALFFLLTMLYFLRSCIKHSGSTSFLFVRLPWYRRNMPAKRVHWADEEEGPAFVPPPTPWTPPLMLTNTDDSLTESPPPPTPRSASGGLQQQDLLTECGDTSGACATASAPSAQFIPSHEAPAPVTPIFDAGTHYHQSHSTFNNIHSLLPSQSLSRLSPQRAQLALNLYLDHSAEAPSLIWDICEEPSESTVRLAGDTPVPDALLEAAATDPPTQEMRIQCIWHAGWQPLTIRVSTSPTGTSPQSPQYITILMVIKEMYKYLNRRVTGAEYARFGAIPGEQDAVSRAFYARCERHLRQNPPIHRTVRERAERETQSGLRRVDCLRGHTTFLGLTSSEDEEGLWHVHGGPATWWPDQK